MQSSSDIGSGTTQEQQSQPEQTPTGSQAIQEQEQQPQPEQPQASELSTLDGKTSSMVEQTIELGQLFTSILVTISAHRTVVVHKKLVEIYEHDSFRTLCTRILDAQTSARLGEHYKIQVSFLLGQDWIQVSRAEQPVKTTLTRFPDACHIKLQLASINQPGYTTLRPLNKPRRERLFKIAGFVVKGILLYEVAALATNVLLSMLGKMPEPEDPEDELDAVLRAMDTEQLLEVQRRAKGELKKLETTKDSPSISKHQRPSQPVQRRAATERMGQEGEPWVSSGPEGDDEAMAIGEVLAGINKNKSG